MPTAMWNLDLYLDNRILGKKYIAAVHHSLLEIFYPQIDTD